MEGQGSQAEGEVILYAISADDEASVARARAWLRYHGITTDDARLVRRDGMVLVEDRGETWRRIKAGPDGH